MMFLAGVALAARSNGPGDYALTDGVSFDTWPESGNDSDRLVTNGETWLNRIFTPQNMDVRPTDRSGRDFDERLTIGRLRYRLVHQLDFSRCYEGKCFHRSGDAF